MIVFNSTTGDTYLNGTLLHDKAYSGHGEGVNNVAMEKVHEFGPIPRGDYSIGDWIPHHPTLGIWVAPLFPKEGTDTFGRSGFFIHGDTRAMNHTASHGCVIENSADRTAIRESGAKLLRVV